MNRDEAYEKLVESVESNVSAQFKSVDDAFLVAGQAINFILDNVDKEADEPKPEATD